MAKIAYILLCHKDPAGVIAQAERLTAAGDVIAIHFDRSAPLQAYEQIHSALCDNPSVVFAKRRIKCGWGEWSLVEATLQALRAAVTAFPRATHFYMLSGDCMPIKSAEYAHAFLANAEIDYIESFDFFASDWIKTGIKEDRLIYRHWFNERTQKRRFYGSLALQRKLGLTRPVPQDLAIQIGSQWWCLRRRTVEVVLEFISQRPDVLRFFRTTWIPDETFFQTLVRHLVPEAELQTRPLTFLMFTDYGMPVTFYNDHYELLLSQDYLFARKISPEATMLKSRLGELYAEEGRSFPISGEGRNLLSFLTARGRVGRRFAPRFWEAETALARGRILYIVTCKKWHVAKRLVQHMRELCGIPAVDYVFSEQEAGLPDLGGIQTTLDKRTRHHRALVSMLFDHWNSDKLILCIDPASVELIQDLYNGQAQVKLLEIQCDFSDDYLIGHARRVGLAGDQTPRATIERLLPTIRYDVRYESERISASDFANFHQMRQSASGVENAAALERFLEVGTDQAQNLAATDYLFAD